jgi:hypothetical protein
VSLNSSSVMAGFFDELESAAKEVEKQLEVEAAKLKKLKRVEGISDSSPQPPEDTGSDDSEVSTVKKSSSDSRGYFGLMFGMTPKDVQHVKNEKIVCKPLDLRDGGEYYNDMGDMRSWMSSHPDNRVWNLGPLWSRDFGNYCTRVGYESTVNLFFDYKESPYLSGVRFKHSELGELANLVGKLKKKYKFISGPGISETIKRLSKGYLVEYWFENNISPKKPKYISLHTSDKNVMISYYSEEAGLKHVSKILAFQESERVKKEQARKAKLSEDDDL